MEQGCNLQQIQVEDVRRFQTHKYRLINSIQKSIEIM